VLASGSFISMLPFFKDFDVFFLFTRLLVKKAIQSDIPTCWNKKNSGNNISLNGEKLIMFACCILNSNDTALIIHFET
jgi:hypothetical protein